MTIDAAKRDIYRQKIKRRGVSLLGGLFRLVLIGGISFVILYPILFMLFSSIKEASDLSNFAVVWLPLEFSWTTVKNNWNDAAMLMDYGNSLIRSLLFIAVTTGSQLISSCLIGYGLARFRFPFKKFIFACIIATIIIPPFTTIIPNFVNFQNFFGTGVNLLDTWWPFFLTCITGHGLRSGLFIFIMKQFFEGIPKELDEAASIDGCGTFRTFLRVMLPCAMGAVLVVGLFSLVWQWMDTFYTSMYIPQDDLLINALMGIQSKFTNLITTQKTYFPNPRSASDSTLLIQTSSLMVILPLLAVFLVCQRNFVDNISRTGLVE